MCRFKTLATALLLSGSLFATTTQPVGPHKALALKPQPPKKAGRWHMAENGHAIFCYGPVIVTNVFPGEPKRYATQCQGGLYMVPLRD